MEIYCRTSENLILIFVFFLEIVSFRLVIIHQLVFVLVNHQILYFHKVLKKEIFQKTKTRFLFRIASKNEILGKINGYKTILNITKKEKS
jgi:hypothetical protein